MLSWMPVAGVTDGDGVNLPDDPGSAAVWFLFLAVLAILYLSIRRTRRRAEQDWEERRRRLEAADDGDDPGEGGADAEGP